MNTGLIQTANEIATRLSQLENERLRIGTDGMAVLKRLDPEMAKFAEDLWDDPEAMADWFTQEVESLGWQTPWHCIAEGKRDEVMKILNAIAYGLPF